MKNALFETHFSLNGQTSFYRGKVRDVYEIRNEKLLVFTTDRISAFDHILQQPVPQKGAVLNLISAHNLNSASRIVPVWLENVPHPYISVGKLCEPVPVEMVIRGYLCGHALREYQSGKRTLCGQPLPDNLKPYEKLPEPIITPTTKAAEGHDLDISPREIIEKNILTEVEYEQLAGYTHALFRQGQLEAVEKGLILADTKYEFGRFKGEMMLIDEVHTPDSSRFFMADDHGKALFENRPPEQLSKEFARQWLIEQGFDGTGKNPPPAMPENVISSIRERYIRLYETFTGLPFDYIPSSDLESELKEAAGNAIV